MWTTKILIGYNKGFLISRLCQKYYVSVYGYPSSYKVFKDYVLLNASIVFNGPKEKIKCFIKELKMDKRFVNLELNNNYGIITLKQHKATAFLLDPNIILLKPHEVNRSGEYIFEVGSWGKEHLLKLIDIFKKSKFDIKVLWIKNIKPMNVFVIAAYSSITNKQEYCFKLAIENGYYNYPRKITLKELAKIAKISYSTYQFHLRNAEKKVIPKLH